MSTKTTNTPATRGTRLAAEVRAACNKHTPEQREAAIKRGMEIINGANQTRPLTARLMWAMTDPHFHILNEGEKRLTMRSPHDTVPAYVPVAVLDVSDPAALLERVTDALCISPAGRRDQAPEWFREAKRLDAREVLKALGLPCPCTKVTRK